VTASEANLGGKMQPLEVMFCPVTQCGTQTGTTTGPKQVPHMADPKPWAKLHRVMVYQSCQDDHRAVPSNPIEDRCCCHSMLGHGRRLSKQHGSRTRLMGQVQGVTPSAGIYRGVPTNTGAGATNSFCYCAWCSTPMSMPVAVSNRVSMSQRGIPTCADAGAL